MSVPAPAFVRLRHDIHADRIGTGINDDLATAQGESVPPPVAGWITAPPPWDSMPPTLILARNDYGSRSGRKYHLAAGRKSDHYRALALPNRQTRLAQSPLLVGS